MHVFERLASASLVLCVVLAAPAATQQPRDSAVAPLRIGNWLVAKGRSADNKNGLIVLAPPASEGRRPSGKIPVLMVRCEGDDLSVMINWIDYIGIASGDVTMQVGNAPAEKKTWKFATSNRVLFYPSNPKKVLRAMVAVDRVSAETTPFREPPLKAVFLLQGLNDALGHLKPACDID